MTETAIRIQDLTHDFERRGKKTVSTRAVDGLSLEVPSGAVFGFLGGALGLGLGAAIALVLLVTTIPAHLDAETERAAILALMLAHVPLMIVEGVFTALVVLFLQKVKPDLLSTCPLT